MNPDRILESQAKRAGLGARVLVSAMFLTEGFAKIGNYEGVARYMEAAGGFLFLVARGPGPWSLDARRAAAAEPAQ